jgi:hypothetical protein
MIQQQQPVMFSIAELEQKTSVFSSCGDNDIQQQQQHKMHMNCQCSHENLCKELSMRNNLLSKQNRQQQQIIMILKRQLIESREQLKSLPKQDVCVPVPQQQQHKLN